MPAHTSRHPPRVHLKRLWMLACLNERMIPHFVPFFLKKKKREKNQVKTLCCYTNQAASLLNGLWFLPRLSPELEQPRVHAAGVMAPLAGTQASLHDTCTHARVTASVWKRWREASLLMPSFDSDSNTRWHPFFLSLLIPLSPRVFLSCFGSWNLLTLSPPSSP